MDKGAVMCVNIYYIYIRVLLSPKNEIMPFVAT